MSDTKLIYLTGCTRGIGYALAAKFSTMGHRVIGCGTNTARIAEMQSDSALTGDFSVVDICDAEAVAAWAGEKLRATGVPDVLICNAGIINPTMPFWELPKETFDRVVEVNVKGTANVLRALMPAMVERGEGVIANLSSGCGLYGFPNVSAYCASKFAIEGLSKSIAEELPESMSCVPLSPGVINTEMLQDYWGDERAGRCDDPEAWAAYAAPFILSLGRKDNGKSTRVPQG